jgi:hypothetical protein
LHLAVNSLGYTIINPIDNLVRVQFASATNSSIENAFALADQDKRRAIAQMTTNDLLEVIMAGIMAATMSSVVIDRLILHRAGLGARTIQLTSVGLLVPAVVLLSLQGSLDHQALGTLLGAVAGYTLSPPADESPDPRFRQTSN